MLETKINNENHSKVYSPIIRIIDDIIPFIIDISVLVRAKYKRGINSFVQDSKRIDITPYNNGFRGWIDDREKGSYQVVFSDKNCIDLYPGWNLIIIKNKEIEMFLRNRFFIDSKGQFMEVTLIKDNKAFLDTVNNTVYKSFWLMLKKETDLLPFYIRDKYLDNKNIFILESQKKVLIIFGDQGRGYYRYTFMKEAINNSYWIYSFAGFDELGYKFEEKKRCLTEISPECYLLSRRQFITFEDPLIASIIKLQLGISGRGILPSDLMNLKELNLDGYKIYSINGLEKCIGLQVLKINGHYVSGLAEIAFSLPKLKKIFLSKELYSTEELKTLASFL